MSIRRRDFLLASMAVAACGQEPAEMPIIPSKYVPKNLPKPMFRQSPASPVHLSAFLVLRSGSSGAVPAAAMMNPMGQDMEITEIKFELQGDFGGLSAPIMGATIWCDLTMGTVKITNGSVPVWNFGRAENLAAELKGVPSPDTVAFGAYTWRLPRPLFVPAGAALIPTFSHTALITNTIGVRVGYSARTVFNKPKKFYIPWVAKYASKSFNPMSAAGVDTSSELDLVNPHPEVLHLQRLTGRTILTTSYSLEDTANPAFGSQYLKLRITDSYGRPVVRSFTPFYSVFSPLTRSWEMDNGVELDPGAYYKVDFRKEAMTLASGNSAQAFISMVGWRELEGQ